MRFTLLAVVIPLALLVSAGALVNGPYDGLGKLLGLVGFVWLAFGVRAVRIYWRTRVRAKAWKDAFPRWSRRRK